MTSFFTLSALVLGVSGLSLAQSHKVGQKDNSRRDFSFNRLLDLRDVASRLEGTIDSSGQSLLDRDYVDVRVTHCEIEVRDLPGHLDPSLFLYVEQALSLSLEAPYRQRVIKLSPDGLSARGVVSSIYEVTIPPQQLLNLCGKSQDQRVLSWSNLKDVQCSVYMNKVQDLWVGETQKAKCPNDYGSAKFVSSKVRLSKTGMYSWDQGWDAEGNQVWGAVKGGYNFEKMNPKTTDVELNGLASRYIGKLNTFNQATKSPGVFQPIRYNNCLIDVPTLSSRPGRTILVDQSAETPTLKFNRTKFLRLERNDRQELEATYLSLQDGSKYQGLCDRPVKERVGAPQDVLAPECRITFVREGRDFVGRTPESGCPSTYKGAVKLTVEARLTRSSIQVLERWYDKDGMQVAGSTQGPYVYELED
jgi:hypothetical protein